MSKTILIVDDDPSVVASLVLALKQAGYASRTASHPRDALRLLRNEHCDAVLQDMNFSRKTSGEEGLQLLGQIKAEFPLLPVLLITAWGSIDLAVQGVKSGAADFITKPWSNEQLIQRIGTLLALHTAGQEYPSVSRDEVDKRYDCAGMVGCDPKLLKILDIVGRIAATEAPVLITGESGTGKELIAEIIHRNSAHRSEHLVKVNLGSITPTLFESELFGHIKGSFTGAIADRKGRFEHAHNGTIFLDEIGDLDFSCQVKLLRVLQESTFEAVGSSITRSVNVRVISATNRNLQEMITLGRFREDLLYRLNLIAIHLPPLRERRDDIPLLTRHFLAKISGFYRRDPVHIAPEAQRWLQSRAFPGNIRELQHLIERTVLMSNTTTLQTADFLQALAVEQNEGTPAEPLPAVGSMTLDDMEQAMILKALEQYPDNISRVAEILGLTRQALYRRLEKYGITP